VTNAGVFNARAPEAELKNQTHRFTRLGNTLPEIVTQYRLNPPKHRLRPSQ
jgi:hypothetical protein